MPVRLSPFVLPAVVAGPVAVSEVITSPAFMGARILAGSAGSGRRIARVNVMQIPTAEFARADELVLTTSTAFDESDSRLDALMAALAEREIAALAAHRPALEQLGPEAIAIADAHPLPLIELPEHARLNSVLREVLERLIAQQTTQLEEDRRVRELLADLALAGSGIEELPVAIGELTGGKAALVDGSGRVLAASEGKIAGQVVRLARAWLRDDWNAPAAADGGWIVWPIRAAGRRLGCLVVCLADEATHFHRAVFEHGSRNAALAILQTQAAQAEATRLREQFINDLLAGSLEPDPVRERAELLGWTPDVPYRVVLGRHAGQAGAELLEHARQPEPELLAVEHYGGCLAIVTAEPDDDAASRVAAALRGFGSEVRVGISGIHTGMAELSVAAAEAEEMLAAATTFEAQPARRFDPMDPLRVLALVPRAELIEFADHVLEPLDRLEAERRTALMETLEILLQTGLNVAAAAREGEWHYNTVRYRIRGLTQLLGPFLENGELLQSLTLAILIRRELGPPRARQRAQTSRAA
jgi:purine catabolism regulator